MGEYDAEGALAGHFRHEVARNRAVVDCQAVDSHVLPVVGALVGYVRTVRSDAGEVYLSGGAPNPLSDHNSSATVDGGSLDGLYATLVLTNTGFQFVAWSAPGSLFAVVDWEVGL